MNYLRGELLLMSNAPENMTSENYVPLKPIKWNFFVAVWGLIFGSSVRWYSKLKRGTEQLEKNDVWRGKKQRDENALYCQSFAAFSRFDGCTH